MNKRLLDLTNAYLAVEALLQSRFLSEETHKQLQDTLRVLDREAKQAANEVEADRHTKTAA